MSRSAAYYCAQVEKVTVIVENLDTQPVTVTIKTTWCPPTDNLEKQMKKMEQADMPIQEFVVAMNLDEYLEKYTYQRATELWRDKKEPAND